MFQKEFNQMSRAMQNMGMTCVMTNELGKYGAMLAGGAINSVFSGRTINDLDFYFPTKEDCEKAEDYLKSMEFKVAFQTDNAVSLVKFTKKKVCRVQIITRFTGTPTEILETFDFTCVQALYDFAKGEFVMKPRFLPDVAKRQLVYTRTSQFPICALYRTKKYQERGYSISGANIVALSLAVHSLKFETYGDLKAQLMGIDTALLNEISKGYDDSKKFELSEFMEEWYNTAIEEVFDETLPEMDALGPEDLA